MADSMFVQPYVKIGGQRKYTVLLSIVAHTLVIAVALIVPLVATDTIVLPAQFAMMAFHTRPPLLPSPPPPPSGVAVREQQAVAQPTVPIEAPATISEETAIQPIGDPFAAIESSPGIVSGGELPSPPPPSLPVAPQVTVRPGGDIKPPVKVKDVAPIYPRMALAAQVQGIVILEATIGPDGRVQDARIQRSNNPLLDAAALDAVRQWEYTPTLLNGNAVAVIMTVTVNFRLR